MSDDVTPLEPLPNVTSFSFWCQKVLPAVYEDSLSYYEVLCKVVEYLNGSTSGYNKVIDRLNENSKLIKDLEGRVLELERWRNDYPDIVLQWVNDNMERIIKDLFSQIYFGINEEGYLATYAPQSWNDIVFDTGYDCTKDTFGRLILRWDADSPYTVDQTPEPANWV